MEAIFEHVGSSKITDVQSSDNYHIMIAFVEGVLEIPTLEFSEGHL